MFACLVEDVAFLLFDSAELLIECSDTLFEMFLFEAYLLAFVGPIALVACDVLELAVVVYMLLADQFSSMLDDRWRQAGLFGYLDSETAACLSNR